MLRSEHINGSWVGEPCRVKLEVARFFEERFKEVEEKRPKLDGVKLKTISREDNNMLEAFFLMRKKLRRRFAIVKV